MTNTDAAVSEKPLLEISDLSVVYPTGFRRPPFKAVTGVSIEVGRGETVSIVGESGSGKSTIGGAVLGLRDVAAGSIRFRGEDITSIGQSDRRRLSADLQAIFQDPFSSLDPSKTVGETVGEPLVVGTDLSSAQITARVEEVLRRVGIAVDAVEKYPGEFSGGQRQRIAIARAVVRRPALIVADEAVSALDVSVQAHVLNLLDELQKDQGTSYLFISHNMAVVRHISDRVVVLYRGRIMEEGGAEDVCDRPAHPYTRSLLAAVPVPDVTAQRSRRSLRRAATTADSGFAPVDGVGCPFAPRCPFAQQKCIDATPTLEELPDGRRVACVRVGELPAQSALLSTGSKEAK
jgi:oligopeptide/dipeptide ABC transporter ATP-binding protein